MQEFIHFYAYAIAFYNLKDLSILVELIIIILIMNVKRTAT